MSSGEDTAHRAMEHHRNPVNKSMHLQPTDFQQRSQKHTTGKGQTFKN